MAQHHVIPQSLANLIEEVSPDISYNDYLIGKTVDLNNHSNHPNYNHIISFILGMAYKNNTLDLDHIQGFANNLINLMSADPNKHPDQYSFNDLVGLYPR